MSEEFTGPISILMLKGHVGRLLQWLERTAHSVAPSKMFGFLIVSVFPPVDVETGFDEFIDLSLTKV